MLDVRSYLEKARDLLRREDVRSLQVPGTGMSLGTVMQIPSTIRTTYRAAVDPIREAVQGELEDKGVLKASELLSPVGGMRVGSRLGRGVAEESGTLSQRLESYGQRWRDRPSSPTKTAVELAVDPLNTGFAIGPLVKAPSSAVAARVVLRDLALPVTGVIAGDLVQQSLDRESESSGRETGQLIGASALPLVLGAVGKSPLSGSHFTTKAKWTAAPRADVVKQEVTSDEVYKKIGKALDTAFNFSRELLLGLDPGQMLRVSVIATPQAIAAGKPLRGLDAVRRGFEAAFSPVFDPKYMEKFENTELYRRWAPILRISSQKSPESADVHGLLKKVPVFGTLERMVFERFLPTFAIYTSEAVYQGMKETKRWANLGEGEAREIIGKRVRDISMGRPPEQWETPLIRFAERLVFLAPNWLRGQVRNFYAPFLASPEGDLARRYWATVLVLSAGLSVGLTSLFTGRDPLDLMNPLHPDSTLNPRKGGRFLGIELGRDGPVITPFQPITVLARAVLRPFAAAAQEVQRGLDEDYETSQLFLDAVGAFLGELQQSSSSYFKGKLSLPARLYNDLVITGTDFHGYPITTADNPVDRTRDRLFYIVRNMSPMFVHPLMEPTHTVPGAEPRLSDRVVQTAYEWLTGTPFIPAERYPPGVKEAFRRVITENGGDPNAVDPVREFFALNIPVDQRSKIYAQHPEIRDFINARTDLAGERAGKPAGKAAVTAYKADLVELKVARDNALIELEKQIKENPSLSGDWYRSRRRAINDLYVYGKEQLGRTYFGTTDKEIVRQKVYGDRRNTEDEMRDLLDDFYSIEPEGNTPEDIDRFFERRREFLDQLSPDMRQRFLEKRLADAPTETEREYILASERVAEIMDTMPLYKGLTVKESREVQRLFARARSRARAAGSLPEYFKIALLSDKYASPRIISKAFMIAFKPSIFTNEARRAALTEPKVMRFYSDLPFRESMDIILSEESGTRRRVGMISS